MSLSPINTPPPLPTNLPQVDTQTAVQVQARAQVAVPPTAVTTSSKQEASSGFARPDSQPQRGAPTGGRGRIVDISV
jgi:hypothetical protein